MRMSLTLGWLVALCPAMCLAGLAVQILRILGRALAQVQTLDITVLGQHIATVDPLALLQLRSAADAIDRLTAGVLGTFLLFTLVLMGAMPLGNILVGAIAEAIGTTAAIAAFGVALCAAIVLIAAARREVLSTAQGNPLDPPLAKGE